MRRERIQQKRQCDDEIVQRHSRVRSRPLRKILKRMMTDDQPRVFPDHLGTRHARVTIRIHEVNIPSDKNVVIIRAARRQNQRAEKRDLKNNQRKTSDASHRIDNRKSTIENRKLNWARQDSNLGPRDYESPALTAELQAHFHR
jgi:uncharacterized protein YpiB (UPF0302 family)